MSGTGKRLSLVEAEKMAAAIIEQIDGESYVVGSIRRKKAEVGDIEILVHHDAAIRLDVGVGPMFPGEYEKLKGGPRNIASVPWRYWRYWQLRQRKTGIHVDLFRFDDDNRGSMRLIRTGPADFSKRFVIALRRQGLCHEDGYVCEDTDDALRIACTNEHNAFRLAGMAYIDPENRH